MIRAMDGSYPTGRKLFPSNLEAAAYSFEMTQHTILDGISNQRIPALTNGAMQ